MYAGRREWGLKAGKRDDGCRQEGEMMDVGRKER